jgi:PAS domain S-box-containing protein
MKGERKTKAQLINELAVAHRRIAELERSAAEENGGEEVHQDKDLLSGQLHLLQQLLDGIPIPVFYKDIQGKYLGCNKSYEEFIGLTRNQLIGKTVYDIAPHNLAGIYNAADADLFNHRGVQVYETSVLHADGSRHDVVLNKATYKDINGNMAGIVGAIMDITTRKQAEEALKESEERFKAQYHGSPTPAFTWQKREDDFILVDYNDAAAVITNGGVAQYIGKTAHKMYELQLDVLENFERCFEEKTIIRKELWSKYFLPGRLIITTYVFVPNDLVMVHVEDITDRKMSEEMLRESIETARALLNAPPDPAYLLSTEGQILALNIPGAKVFGRQVADIIGLNMVDILPPELARTRKARINQIVLTGEPVRFEDERAGKYYDNTMYPLLDNKGNVNRIAVFTHNITDHKLAEEERMRLEAQLVQAQKMEAIGTLAGGIAHDFNNILSAILGYSELVLDDVLEPEKVKSEIKEVIKAADRAKDLVKQILTFSRGTETTYSPLELSPIIKESFKMLRSVIPTTIEFRPDIINSGLVMSDPTQIYQLMMNLCTNAAHAMDKTGGVLTVSLKKVDIDTAAASGLDLSPGPYLRLSISDTGHGMTSEVRERIFEPYYTTKVIGRGTGLGLSVVHGIVNSHGGAITCESEPGKWTTFDVYLPEIKLKTVQAQSRKREPLLTGTECILFIDDEQTLVNLAKMMLSKLGYDVVTRTNSTEALELFQESPKKYDLVISDMTMPGMSGDKLVHKIMEIRHDIPIILCTGYSEHISEEKAKNIGVREFVMKPLEMKELAKTIRKVLDRG